MACACGAYLFWNDKQKKNWQEAYEKEEKLKLIRVQSNELENRARFLDIKLNSDIAGYPGFAEIDPLNGNVGAFVNTQAGEKSWYYPRNFGKYNRVGGFEILDPNLERYLFGYKESEANNFPHTSIILFTLNDRIYKIKFTVKENENAIGGGLEPFADFLRMVYGPCVNDNGHNDVDYRKAGEFSWESNSVLLTTVAETKVCTYRSPEKEYYTVINRFTKCEYVFKPLANQLDSLQNYQSKIERQKQFRDL